MQSAGTGSRWDLRSRDASGMLTAVAAIPFLLPQGVEDGVQEHTKFHELGKGEEKTKNWKINKSSWQGNDHPSRPRKKDAVSQSTSFVKC